MCLNKFCTVGLNPTSKPQTLEQMSYGPPSMNGPPGLASLAVQLGVQMVKW